MKSFDEYWYAPEHSELRKSCAMGWAMRVWNASRDVTLSEQPAYPPAITHCDNCGCDWLDNGLNPIGCPYCKKPDTNLVEALETYLRLRNFAEDWEAPGMEVYDDRSQKPSTDVSKLVEALEAIQKAATLENIRTGTHAAAILGYISSVCDITLATHCKQRGIENE